MQLSTVAPSSVRVVELDALRGLAALAVVVFHYTTHYQNEVGHTELLGFGFPAGNYGVQLFFLISGFVIFMTLERTRTTMDFVVSRISRLFPAYWTAMAITAVVVYSIGLPAQKLPLSDLLLDLTMVQETFGAEHLDGSYWTLRVELFFYVQMLFWFMLGQLRRIRTIIGIWLLLAVAYGLFTKSGSHFSYSMRTVLILRHIPFFAMGILFYRIHAYPGPHRGDACLIGLCLLAIAIAYAPVYGVVAGVCAAIFGLFVTGRLNWLRTAPLAYLGAISYSLYLLHQSIGFVLIHQMEQRGIAPLTAVMLTVGAILVLASALTYLVERPVLRRIRSAWRSRSRLGLGPGTPDPTG
ncbi:MAG TPA: acyltransferase [Lysobacter sp.]|nr:acyltransferase [Lysobacter sp.]